MCRVHGALVVLFFIGIAASPLGAQSPPAQPAEVPEDVREDLLERGSVKKDRDSWRDASLAPEHPFSEEIRDRLQQARPNVLSETLILVERRISDAEYVALYNSLREVRELASIDYYNPEKDKWHPLFEYSYHVETPESTTPLPDPVVDSIPESEAILVRQGLPPFGDTVARYSYTARQDSFRFSGENLTRITYKGFPVVATGYMVTEFLLIRREEYLLVYGVGGARVFNLFGLLSGVIENSFTSRTTGLFDWYTRNYLEPLRNGNLTPAQ